MAKDVDRALAAVRTALEKRLAEEASPVPSLGPPDLLGDRIESGADGKPAAIVHRDGRRTPLEAKTGRAERCF